MPRDPNWGNILKSLKKMRAQKDEYARSQVPQYTGPYEEKEEEVQSYETPANISAMPNNERSGSVMNPSRFQGINENILKMDTENSLGIKPSFDYLPDKSPGQIRKQMFERNVASDNAARESYLMDRMSGGISGFKNQDTPYGGGLNGQISTMDGYGPAFLTSKDMERRRIDERNMGEDLKTVNTSNVQLPMSSETQMSDGPEEASLSYKIGEGARDGYEAISSGISGAGTLLSRFAEGIGQGWEAGRPKPPVATTTNSTAEPVAPVSPTVAPVGPVTPVAGGGGSKAGGGGGSKGGGSKAGGGGTIQNSAKKDLWGRPLGDKWFGFNPKTNKYEQGAEQGAEQGVGTGSSGGYGGDDVTPDNTEKMYNMFKTLLTIGAVGFGAKGALKYAPKVGAALGSTKLGSKLMSTSTMKKLSEYFSKLGTKTGPGVTKDVGIGLSKEQGISEAIKNASGKWPVFSKQVASKIENFRGLKMGKTAAETAAKTATKTATKTEGLGKSTTQLGFDFPNTKNLLKQRVKTAITKIKKKGGK